MVFQLGLSICSGSMLQGHLTGSLGGAGATLLTRFRRVLTVDLRQVNTKNYEIEEIRERLENLHCRGGVKYPPFRQNLFVGRVYHMRFHGAAPTREPASRVRARGTRVDQQQWRFQSGFLSGEVRTIFANTPFFFGKCLFPGLLCAGFPHINRPIQRHAVVNYL